MHSYQISLNEKRSNPLPLLTANWGARGIIFHDVTITFPKSYIIPLVQHTHLIHHEYVVVGQLAFTSWELWMKRGIYLHYRDFPNRCLSNTCTKMVKLLVAAHSRTPLCASAFTREFYPKVSRTLNCYNPSLFIKPHLTVYYYTVAAQAHVIERKRFYSWILLTLYRTIPS